MGQIDFPRKIIVIVVYVADERKKMFSSKRSLIGTHTCSHHIIYENVVFGRTDAWIRVSLNVPFVNGT